MYGQRDAGISSPRPRRVLESTLQRRAISLLRQQGAYVFKVVGSPMQQRGTPDLLVCYKGRFIALEIKVPGAKLDKLQEYEMAKIREAGGAAARVESIEEVYEQLD